jgi:Tfp pilus tip-associated adhesin PilY1
MTGSGYFPAVEDLLPGRGASAPRAGQSFYLLKAEDGTLLANPTGACSGTGCLDVGPSAAGRMKNALQADPSAAGAVGDFVVYKAYIGDLNGTYWRLNFDATGAMSASAMAATGQPIFSSSALLFVGSANVYMFFSTGSDLLPVTSPYGVGTFQLWGLQDNWPGAGATKKFTVSLAAVTNSGGIANGERPSTAPSVAGDIVFYTTITEVAATPCSSDFSSNLYAFTYLGGAAYPSANDSDTTIGKNESPVVRTVRGRATAPFIVDQHLYFGTAGEDGVKVEAFGDPDDFNNGVGQVGVRILSWREIR